MKLEQLSFNQITAANHSLEDVIHHCVSENIQWIAPWRHKLAETGINRSAQLIHEAGLGVSSLCRGGMFPADSAQQRQNNIDDNKRAIEEAAKIGSDCLVLVCGPSPDKHITEARQMVADGIAAILPYAEEADIKLGIEPLHPMFAADRSVITTLGQANDICEQLPSNHIGVIIDVYHVWWDPSLYEEIQRASGHIFGYHVNDWITLNDPLTSRGMMGDGVIELDKISQAVKQSGYHGPIEVEILNDQLWEESCASILKETKQAFQTNILQT